MPHYKDGSPAQIGDYVIGKPYNTPKVIVGEVIQITLESESCNCIVAFTEVYDAEEFLKNSWGNLGGSVTSVSRGGIDVPTHQKRLVMVAKTDYGETKAFQKVTQANL